jgi:hypothetical protein
MFRGMGIQRGLEATLSASVVIRRRGKVVAWLIPPPRHEPWSPEEVLDGFREIRGGVGASAKIRNVVREGRRY